MKAKISLALFVGASVIVLGISSANAQTLAATPGTDASPYYSTPIGFPPAISLPQYTASGINSVGGSTLQTANPGGQLGNAIFAFQLPNLGAISSPFTSATFSATLASTSGGSAFGFNAFNNNYDLYGLTGGFSPTVTTSQYYAGTTGDSVDTLIQARFPGTNQNVAAGTTFTNSDAGLLDYLNGQYANGAGANAYVFLRISPDFNPSSFSNLSWYSTTSGVTPATLSFTDNVVAAPEPSTYALLLGSALTLLVVARRRKLA